MNTPSSYERLAKVLADSLYAKNLTPLDLVHTLAQEAEWDAEILNKEFIKAWELCKEMDSNAANRECNQPLVLSRGFDKKTAEEELKNFLPEEKILINQDIFRSRLSRINIENIDPLRERALIEILEKESIGLSHNDVLLYYNLIKINSLSESSQTHAKNAATNSGTTNYPEQILKAARRVFPLEKEDIMKINSGKCPDDQALLENLENCIERHKMNPHILLAFFNQAEGKFAFFAKDFISILAQKRGDSVNEILSHCGLYILFQGSKPTQLDDLGFGPPLQAFLSDRIGRVRTVYYAGLLFIYSFTYMLFAQIYEIAQKYRAAEEEQKRKIEKLYASDERINMLLGNSANAAASKIAHYKSEAIDIMNTFKKHLAASKNFVKKSDILA